MKRKTLVVKRPMIQLDLSDEMVFVISRCLGWIDERTLQAIRAGAVGDEVNGIDARDFFQELEKERIGTQND